MADDRRCGTCEHVRTNNGARLPALMPDNPRDTTILKCLAPMPWCVTEMMFVASWKGRDCPTWKAKEKNDAAT